MQIGLFKIVVEFEDIFDKAVDLEILEFEITKEVPGNTQKVEGIRGLFTGRSGGFPRAAAVTPRRLADRFDPGLLDQFLGGIADLLKFPVRQLKKGGENVDPAFELIGDRFFDGLEKTPAFIAFEKIDLRICARIDELRRANGLATLKLINFPDTLTFCESIIFCI